MSVKQDFVFYGLYWVFAMCLTALSFFLLLDMVRPTWTSVTYEVHTGNGEILNRAE